MRPDRLRARRELAEVLRRCAAGELPPNVALAQLAAAAESAAELEQALSDAAQSLATETAAGGAVLRAALDLWHETPRAWTMMRGVLAAAGQGVDGANEPQAIADWADRFDHAAVRSPEASVALYSLGRADLLAAATGEIVSYIRGQNLLAPTAVLVEIGCGNGRCLAALAEETHFAIGLDISGEMLRQARRRCAGLGNVALLRSAGRDLAMVGDGCADLVLAVDSFPYLLAAGERVADRHVAEARRVLRPGGALLILNYSYRGDPARDGADLDRLASRYGFVLAVRGERPFRHWDGTAFLLKASA